MDIMLRRLPPTLLALLPALLLVLGLGALLLHPGFRGELASAWSLLLAGDPDPLREWLAGFGAWAPVASALLQVATSVFPPLPSFLLGIANAMLYGLWWGALLTFVTALVAAAVCFGIGRAVGRPGVERLVSASSLERMDAFVERRGVLAVFLGRLIPFVNPDVVSYGAGVTRIGWIPFLAAIFAGSIPATLFYSVVGATAIEASGRVILLVTLSAVAPLLVLALVGRKWAGRRSREKGEGAAE